MVDTLGTRSHSAGNLTFQKHNAVQLNYINAFLLRVAHSKETKKPLIMSYFSPWLLGSSELNTHKYMQIHTWYIYICKQTTFNILQFLFPIELFIPFLIYINDTM